MWKRINSYDLRVNNYLFKSLLTSLFSFLSPSFFFKYADNRYYLKFINHKALMQGKLFQTGVRIFCTSVYCLWAKKKHKTNVTVWHGIHFLKNNIWNILVIGNYMVLSLNCFHSSGNTVQYSIKLYMYMRIIKVI